MVITDNSIVKIAHHTNINVTVFNNQEIVSCFSLIFLIYKLIFLSLILSITSDVHDANVSNDVDTNGSKNLIQYFFFTSL